MIVTYKKHWFSPFSAAPDDIDHEDIAHALAYLCRANGHFDRFFSVAQHSINCMREAEARGLSGNAVFMALMHDASEAYLSDITRPVKRLLPAYNEAEDRLQSLINEKYGIICDPADVAAVRAVDSAMLYHEFLAMAGEKLAGLEDTLVSVPDFAERPFKAVREEFLAAFKRFVR